MKKKMWFLFAPIGALAVLIAGIVIRVSEIPGSIFLTNGSSREIEFHLPFFAKLDADVQDVVQFSGTSLKDVDAYDMNDPIVLTTQNSGNASISVDLFGLIPIKDINVTVGEEVLLYPGGQSIGVMLYTEGALVVGSSEIETADGEYINPADVAGLEPGDVIKKVNGTPVEDADQLSALINKTQEHSLFLTVDREGTEREIMIEAVKNAEGEYKLGVWVRDSTAGVGTLTFYEPETGTLAGLGHAITDVDTGSTLQVKNGEIILSEVSEVIKGKEGEPGELKGVFDPLEEVIGYISDNTEFGVYGESEAVIENGIAQPMPAAARDEISEGAASIYCSVDDGGVKEYTCEIEQLTRQNTPQAKSFVVHITDEALLERTGGIVQGMSGSPILQNGKIVGAVTHVFIDDPTRGYGIYIDWMLEQVG